MSRTRNPFQLIEGFHGGHFDSLAADREIENLYPEIEENDFGNITTQQKLEYSNTLEIPRRQLRIERTSITNNDITIVLESGAAEPNTSLRIIAINNKKLFESLDFYRDQSPIQREMFFPIQRGNHNKKFPMGTRVTDTILKKGMNKITFKDYEVTEHLYLYFVFYYDNNDDFQVYSQELLIEDTIMDSDIVVDQRVPTRRDFSAKLSPSTEPNFNLDFLSSKQNKALFSQLYNTVDTKNNLRFLFAFDVGRYLRNHTQFPELLRNMFLTDFIQSYEIERYRQARSVGFMMKDNRYPKTIGLSVIDNLAASDNIVFFGGIDENTSKGLYTYRTNLVIKDNTIQEAMLLLEELRTIEYKLLELEDSVSADDESIYDLINFFPGEFMFLSGRADSQSRLSDEILKKTIDIVHNKIEEYERRLTLKKSVSSTIDMSGDELLRTFAHNGEQSARRMTTIHHEFSTVEFKQYRNMGLGLTLDDELSFKKIKIGGLKEYITIYKEDRNTLILNKEAPLKPIQAYDEFNNTYDDYKSGSFHVGLKQPKEEKKKGRIPKYMINISKKLHECKIEYLANYNNSNIGDEISVHSENWKEILTENDIKQLSRFETMLCRVKTPEPIYDKYFFATND